MPCGALLAIEQIQDKSAIKRYLNAVFANLKGEVDDLISQFVKLYEYIDLSADNGDFPLEFKKAMQSARLACVQLERMSASNRMLLEQVLDDGEPPSVEALYDMFEQVKVETLQCSKVMTKVFQRFEHVNSALHNFINYLRSQANDAEEYHQRNLSRSTIQKFQEVIPWNYIPCFITDILETLATPRGKAMIPHRSESQVRQPKECLEFAGLLVEPLRRVIEAWGVLLRQVILVSRLLTHSQDYFNVDSNIKEIQELYDFFGCLQEVTREFVDYIPHRKGKTYVGESTMSAQATPQRALTQR